MYMNKRKPFLFGLVGAAGFVVDVTAMALLSQWLTMPSARAGAFWVAASSNWWLNRQLTFKQQKTENRTKEWLKFLTSSCFGFIPNWGCYALLIQKLNFFVSFFEGLGLNHSLFISSIPYLLMVPGILLGMIINFNFADKWVFSRAIS